MPKAPGEPVFKGQPYGAGVAQQAVAASGAPPSPPGAPPAPSGPPGGLGPPPGGLGAFGRPSERPNEPITAGLSRGPGAGPEALGTKGDPTKDLDMADLAIYLPTLELLASMPSASMATKTFVKRLRGAMPIQPPAEAM